MCCRIFGSLRDDVFDCVSLYVVQIVVCLQSIRYPCVSWVCPIIILLIIVFIFVESWVLVHDFSFFFFFLILRETWNVLVFIMIHDIMCFFLNIFDVSVNDFDQNYCSNIYKLGTFPKLRTIIIARALAVCMEFWFENIRIYRDVLLWLLLLRKVHFGRIMKFFCFFYLNLLNAFFFLLLIIIYFCSLTELLVYHCDYTFRLYIVDMIPHIIIFSYIY